MRALKKFLATILIISTLSNYFFVSTLNAVETNSSASPWTIEKAEHLARRALFWPNPEIINSLYDAWSSSAAVNILFPSVDWPNRTEYNASIELFKQDNFSPTDTNKMRRYYNYVRYKDPYEAKRKFFGLFEDIFSVNKQWDILYTDIENHFTNLYDETLWNYKDMVKKTLYNKDFPESSFAQWQFLNLLNQPNKNYPNENYARELMQLFLMLEYKPWEDAETPWSVRNYSEDDVASLAKILTWFKAWNDNKVYFSSWDHNTSTWIVFLSWALKSWDNFSFYNSASWTIDNTKIITSIWWNNWLWDNIIDYIFSKREKEIAYFVAYRMFKYYVHDNPTKNDIQTLWNQLVSNNFELYPTVKYLLSSNMMYSSEAMNSIRYKTPVELTIWTLKLLHYKNPSVDDKLLTDQSILTNFDYTPYIPGSIFWRNWFDDNSNFMNSYFHNQWVTYSSKIAYTTWEWTYDLNDILTTTRVWENWELNVKSNNSNTYSWVINLTNISLNLQDEIVIWKRVVNLVEETSSWNTIETQNINNFWIQNFSIPSNESGSWEINNEGKTSSWDLSESFDFKATSTWSLENTSSWKELLEKQNVNSWSINEKSLLESQTWSSNEEKIEDLNIQESVSEKLPEEPLTENKEEPIEEPKNIPEELPQEPQTSNEVKNIPEEVLEEPQPTSEPEKIEESVPEVTDEVSLLNWIKKLLFPKTYAAEEVSEDILSSSITFSTWEVLFPSFKLKTSSGWTIEFTWSVNLSTSKLNIISWVLTYSWQTYNIASWTADISIWANLERDINVWEMITQMEDYFYFWRRLPEDVKTMISDFLTHDDAWAERLFLPNNTNYRNKYIKAVLTIILTQPEFLLQSWYDLSEDNLSNTWDSEISWNSKLIMVELFGWYDWLHAMVPKDEYSDYKEIRKSMWLNTSDLIDLWDFYLNKSFEPFKEFYDSWELTIVNRVWAPNHSRGHDTAATQVASQKALQTVWTPWLIWELIKNETNPLNNVVLWTNRPNIYTNWNYLNIWGSSALYKNNLWWTTNNEKSYQISTIKNILNSRTYPSDLAPLFKNSITLDNVATQSKASWWAEWSWNNLNQRLTFTKTLIDNDLWITYYVPGGGWYDTHSNQLKANYNLSNRTFDLATDISTFFKNAKNSWDDVTIVVFSEFWRTLETNGTVWTDHGQWGWYFILSTNDSLNNKFPSKVIWDLSVTKEYNNWFWVWVDYRAIYSIILKTLYWIDVKDYFWEDYVLSDYLNNDLPTPKFLRQEYRNSYWNNVNYDVKFKVEDSNFIPNEWSYVKVYTWDNLENLKEVSRWTVANRYTNKDGSFNIWLSNRNPNSPYYYKFEIVDNQYDTYSLTWVITPVEKFRNSNDNTISLTRDSIFQKYSWTSINWKKNIEKLILLNNPVELIPVTNSWATTWTWETSWSWETSTWTITYTQSWSIKTISFSGWINMTFWTWETSVSEITSSGWLTWDWWFVLPKYVDKNIFISKESKYSWKLLKDFYIDKLIKVWADSLWVWMILNQDVILSSNLWDNSKNYIVLTTEDLVNWTQVPTSQVSFTWWKIAIKTWHFSYFAVIEDTILDNDEDNSWGNDWNWWDSWNWWNNWDNTWWGTWWTDNWNWWNNSSGWSNSWGSSSSWGSSWWWGWGWSSRLNRDYCPSWDKSPSYYDKKCELEDTKKSDTKNLSNKNSQTTVSQMFAKNYKKSQKYVISTSKYKWYEIVDISSYKISNTIWKISKYFINSSKYTKEEKEMLVERLNEFLIARYKLETTKQKDAWLVNRYKKQVILLKSSLRKISN